MKTLKIAALTAVVSAVLFAQDLPNKGPIPFGAYDANNDGKITQSEFEDTRAKRMSQKYEQGYPLRNAQNAPTFESIDKNKDGVLSKEELQEHQLNRVSERMNNKGMGQGQGMGMGQGKGMGQGQGMNK